jgi:hypothetical protein
MVEKRVRVSLPMSAYKAAAALVVMGCGETLGEAIEQALIYYYKACKKASSKNKKEGKKQ